MPDQYGNTNIAIEYDKTSPDKPQRDQSDADVLIRELDILLGLSDENYSLSSTKENKLFGPMPKEGSPCDKSPSPEGLFHRVQMLLDAIKKNLTTSNMTLNGISSRCTY